MNKLSWKQRHLYHLRTMYGKRAEEWKDVTTDDRLVYCNIYRRMIEALNELPDEPHNYICVAMNHHMSEDRATLDSIKAVFEGR